MKFLSLAAIASFITLGILVFVYTPIYSVTLDEEFIGYIDNKSEMQREINEYIKHGEGENIAFVELEHMPDYHFCLLKRDVEINNEEVLEKVKAQGINYYKYYAIILSSETKGIVKTPEIAEEIIETLKEKNSANKDKVSYAEIYKSEVTDCWTVEDAVDYLFVKPVVANYISLTLSNERIDIPLEFINPISGYITSRFGERSSIRTGAHTGLDIGAKTGTPIKVAASGTVTFAGWKGSFGNLVIVNHGGKIETYYAHCSSIAVEVGDFVNQGDIIAYVGSTGNSTGPHLHLEIRYDGIAYNPLYYVDY